MLLKLHVYGTAFTSSRAVFMALAVLAETLGEISRAAGIQVQKDFEERWHVSIRGKLEHTPRACCISIKESCNMN